MIKNILFLMILSSCSNSQNASISAWGKSHHIKCFSGGIVIYEGNSTGMVNNEEHSDGYYFQDAATQKLVGVSGSCVITVN